MTAVRERAFWVLSLNATLILTRRQLVRQATLPDFRCHKPWETRQQPEVVFLRKIGWTPPPGGGVGGFSSSYKSVESDPGYFAKNVLRVK